MMKSVFITGGTKGVGYEIAKMFNKKLDHKVIIT